MDPCSGNPASLIRQAHVRQARRSSMAGPEEEARPVLSRNRRASAPPMSTQTEEEALGACASSSLRGKTFKTIGKATVRTFPSAISMKITELPEGWKVVEAQADVLNKDWIAIEPNNPKTGPRGFVLAKEVEPCSPLPATREIDDSIEEPAVDVPLAPRSARRSAPEALRRARQGEEAVEPRSAVAQKPRARTSGEGGTPPRTGAAPPRAPGARVSYQSPRGLCTSPRVSPGMQARQSPRQGLSRSSSYATPSPQADARWLRTSPAGSASPEVMEVIALKEEQVILRESNVDLREKELEKRRELEELAQQVQRLQRSRSELKEIHDAEQRELERQEEKMKEKLVRCRDVVAKAVGSIDELYAQQDREISTRLSTGAMSSGESDGQLASDELFHAKALAQEAGAEVSNLLQTWGEESGESDQENSTIITKKTVEEDFRSERAPLRACNVGF